MWKLALRNLTRNRSRTAMTLGAIVTGAVALILSAGFVADIYVQLGEALIRSNSGHLQIARAGFLGSGSRKPDAHLMDDADELAGRVRASPGVADAMARIALTGLLNNGRADLPVVAEGVEPSREARLGTSMRIVAGRTLLDGDSDGAIVGNGLARALGVGPGDRVVLLASTSDSALNTLDLQVVGVFESFSRDYDARALRIPLQAARQLLDTRGANIVVVSLARTQDTDSIASTLRSTLPVGLELKTWTQINDFYAKTVDLYDRQFAFLRLIVLLMVLLSVANAVNMSVFERVQEFGTMRALGNRGGTVFRLVVAENVALGAIGGALGVVVGILLALLISSIGIPMPPPPNANSGYTAHIRLVPVEALLAFLTALVATVAAGLVPARKASRMSVVEALSA